MSGSEVHNMAMLLTKKYGEVVDDQGKYYFQLMQQLSKDIVGLMELVNTFIQARECPLNLEDVNLQTEIDIIRENHCCPVNYAINSIGYRCRLAPRCNYGIEI